MFQNVAYRPTVYKTGLKHKKEKPEQKDDDLFRSRPRMDNQLHFSQEIAYIEKF